MWRKFLVAGLVVALLGSSLFVSGCAPGSDVPQQREGVVPFFALEKAAQEVRELRWVRGQDGRLGLVTSLEPSTVVWASWRAEDWSQEVVNLEELEQLSGTPPGIQTQIVEETFVLAKDEGSQAIKYFVGGVLTVGTIWAGNKALKIVRAGRASKAAGAAIASSDELTDIVSRLGDDALDAIRQTDDLDEIAQLLGVNADDLQEIALKDPEGFAAALRLVNPAEDLAQASLQGRGPLVHLLFEGSDEGDQVIQVLRLVDHTTFFDEFRPIVQVVDEARRFRLLGMTFNQGTRRATLRWVPFRTSTSELGLDFTQVTVKNLRKLPEECLRVECPELAAAAVARGAAAETAEEIGESTWRMGGRVLGETAEEALPLSDEGEEIIEGVYRVLPDKKDEILALPAPQVLRIGGKASSLESLGESLGAGWSTIPVRDLVENTHVPIASFTGK